MEKFKWVTVGDYLERSKLLAHTVIVCPVSGHFKVTAYKDPNGSTKTTWKAMTDCWWCQQRKEWLKAQP